MAVIVQRSVFRADCITCVGTMPREPSERFDDICTGESFEKAFDVEVMGRRRQVVCGGVGPAAFSHIVMMGFRSALNSVVFFRSWVGPGLARQIVFFSFTA